MKTNMGISEADAKGVAHLVNEILCDEYVLYTKTRNYHWNVTGPQFASLHVFLEEQYRALDAIVDSMAERVRALGGRALGTLAEFKQKAKIQEAPGRCPDADAMIQELAGDHESIVNQLRNDISTCEKKYHDVGTANFLTELMERHEKMAWMLRAHSPAGVPSPS